MVGLLDSQGFRALVRGDDLDELPEALAKYRLVVTFNGASFDLPFLRNEFPDIPTTFAHIDLRWTLRRLGYRGGLKRIEQATGLARPGELSGLTGYHAVLLWELAQQGEDGALKTLVRYNAEDVVSLPRLAEMAVREMALGTPMALSPVPSTPPACLTGLPYDSSVVRYVTGF